MICLIVALLAWLLVKAIHLLVVVDAEVGWVHRENLFFG
jgi:hypothetical protein